MYKTIRNVVLILLTTSLGTTSVQAQDDWEYTLSPLYLWATGIEGESQIGPITAPVDISFSDALDNLDTILTFHFEANKGQHGILANLMHIGLDPESTLPNGATLKTDLTNNILDVAGIYRLNQSDTLEFLYGLRYSDFELEAAIGGMPKATIADESWVDGFIGLRKHAIVSDRSTFIFRGDIGTGSSDLTWSASGIYAYNFNDRFSALAGYRWLSYDYETGNGPSRFTYDVTYEGPLLAAVFHW
jgi:hypothetical protein